MAKHVRDRLSLSKHYTMKPLIILASSTEARGFEHQLFTCTHRPLKLKPVPASYPLVKRGSSSAYTGEPSCDRGDTPPLFQLSMGLAGRLGEQSSERHVYLHLNCKQPRLAQKQHVFNVQGWHYSLTM